MALNTDQVSTRYRERIIDLSRQKLLMSRISGSEQERDLTEPPNAEGLGRIRHFRRGPSARWVQNPLPIDPAAGRLGVPRADQMKAQVYQNAACNWRCWYCFVPFDLLAAVPAHSEWVTALQLVNAYASLPDRPLVLDLSGGQPELTPEWVLWSIDALEASGLQADTYLWSDDNLSNDYFWRFLSEAERERIARFKNYGKVACFKGFNEESFAFNTAAEPTGLSRQFDLFKRYIAEGLDIYAYVTLTHPHKRNITDDMRRFIDRMQDVDPMLPLRTVPLEVATFGPVTSRLDGIRTYALNDGQYQALDVWRKELEKRFSSQMRSLPIDQIRWAGA
ncbi:MAG TPA: hypothetical protein VK539_17055 [Myxococcaceae bacterium]|nr:hypothetical protein [Myxococcaceae bacterium]